MPRSGDDPTPEAVWQQRRAIESRRHPPSLAIHHGVDVVGGLGFPLRDGECLVGPGDGYGWNAARIAHASAMYATRQPDELSSAYRASGRIDVLLAFPGGYTYGHWPVDIAARIQRALDVFDRDRLAFIVPGPLQPWMRFHLDAYGIAPEACIALSDRQTYRAATLALPLLRFSAYLPREPYVRSFARLKAYGHARAGQRGRTGERLFVRHRAQTSAGGRRTLGNEDEIAHELAGLGFTAICPAEMPLVDQIAAFADATLIVGEASSALHSIIYATGARLIVLNAPSHKALLQLSVCRVLGHACTYLFGQDGEDGTFTCEVSAVREAVAGRLSSSG